MFTQETWDARYAESERIWSGNPNPRLVEHVAGLAPGDALDVGCGEGADAVWLAKQGWRVTALDVSAVALEKTAAHAREAGVADRVTTLHHDLMTGAPLPGDYDLVSMQFMHPPPDRFDEFYRLAGATVRSRRSAAGGGPPPPRRRDRRPRAARTRPDVPARAGAGRPSAPTTGTSRWPTPRPGPR